MRIRRLIAVGAGGLVLAGALAACGAGGSSGGNASEAQTSRQDLNTFQQVQPAPHFPYSVYRQDMIEVEAAQALGEQTTSFAMLQGVHDPIWTCPSIGFPIPNTAQLTNPQQVLTWWGSGSSSPDDVVTIGNIDPNGGYAPSASDGTYVECLNSHGQRFTRYWEGPVDTEGTGATWNYSTHTVQDAGQTPSLPICKVETEVVNKKKQQVNLCHLPR
jgi:hypothetical protein